MEKELLSAEQIEKSFNFSRITSELLYNRGFNDIEKIRHFFYPEINDFSNPFSLLNMDKAVNLLQHHIKSKSKIVIFGDYDCDGIGAAAIIYLALKENKIDSEVFLPSREEDGYGLVKESVEKVINKYCPDLIITVDCGIQSVKEVEYLNEKGIDIIITDHHEPGNELPRCILINPKLQNFLHELSGAGIAFYFVNALFGLEAASKYLDICAISTVADLVPIVGDNRLITKFGLKILNSANNRIGIKELIRVSNRNNSSSKILKTSDIAFRLAPRINSTGRISNASKSFQLLVSEDQTEAKIIAEELELDNKYRQELCENIIEQAKYMLLNYDLSNHKIIILHNDKWHAGVIGIAAAKIAEEFNRPTIFFTNFDEESLKGSCRSIKGINIYEILSNCKSIISQFGGHAMAAGLSIKLDNLSDFLLACDKYISDNYDNSVFDLKFDYDVSVSSFKEISIKQAKEIELFEPYGIGNKKPIFRINVKNLLFERIGHHPHLKSKISSDVEMIGFNQLPYYELLNTKLEKSLHFTLDIESFNNRIYVSCILKSIFLNDYSIPKEMLVFNDLQRFLPRKNRVPINRKELFLPNKYFGIICLAWSQTTFEYFKNLYPEFQIEYNNLHSLFPYNTILFSPDRNIFLGYYCKIILGDNPPENYIQEIMNDYKADIEALDLPINSNYSPMVSKNNLSYLYSFIKSNINNIKFIDINYFYNILKSKGLTLDMHIYELCVIILIELEILNIDFDNNIIISNKYNSLDNSLIYKLISRE